jgi:thiamine biosynthesis lipoprotein
MRTRATKTTHLQFSLRWLLVAALCGTAGCQGEDTSGASDASGPLQRLTFRSRTMGTYANVTVFAPDSAAAWPEVREAQNTFVRVDSLMSNWTTTSEVAHLNREAGTDTVQVQTEVAWVLEAALAVGAQSHGAFDITVEPLVRLWGFLGGTPHVPDAKEIAAARERTGLKLVDFNAANRSLAFRRDDVRIDLGGIAKGYGVDAAARTLKKRGVVNAMVEISGNITLLGHPPERDVWTVGIRDPWDRIPYVGVLSLRDRSVATSGKYEQFVDVGGHKYGHILDPRTGWPAEGLLSVTVVAPSAMEADAWGTALFAMGPAAAKALAGTRDDLAVAMITPGAERDTLWVETSLEDRFRLEPEAREFLVLLFF